jgi:hypothetical protein
VYLKVAGQQKTQGRMADKFTGNWVIDHAKSDSQKPLLEAMKKPSWQIYVINDADEDFELLHFEQVVNSKKTHCFTKNVRMFLNSSVLSVLSAIVNIHFNEIKYNHSFEANGAKVHHLDDKKGFGECDSITTYNSSNNTFTIRWQLKTGLLIAVHSLPTDDQFRIDMTMKRAGGVPDVQVCKVYTRKK